MGTEYEEAMVVVHGPSPRLSEPEGAGAVARAVVEECARQVRMGDPAFRAHVVSLTIGQYGVALRIHVFGMPATRSRKVEQARRVFAAVVARALG